MSPLFQLAYYGYDYEYNNNQDYGSPGGIIDIAAYLTPKVFLDLESWTSKTCYVTVSKSNLFVR